MGRTGHHGRAPPWRSCRQREEESAGTPESTPQGPWEGPGGTGPALGCVCKQAKPPGLSPAEEEPQGREWKFWCGTQTKVHFGPLGSVHRLGLSRAWGPQASGTKPSFTHTQVCTRVCTHTHLCTHLHTARSPPCCRPRWPQCLEPFCFWSSLKSLLSFPEGPDTQSVLCRRTNPLGDDCLSARVRTAAPSAPGTRPCLTGLPCLAQSSCLGMAAE